MNSRPEPPGSRPQRQAGVLVEQVKGETILLRLHDGGYYSLDEVGAEIWKLCDGEHAIEEIITAVCAQFDAPESTVRADVHEFVKELLREQLVSLPA